MTTRVLSAIQYCELPRPRLQWIIPSYMPIPGLILLIGEPKAGKSFLGLQVALHVAAGIPFLGQPIEAAPVLYFQFDTSETVWRQRLVDLRSGGTPLPDNLHFVHPDDAPTRVNILSEVTQNMFKTSITACNPKMIVVDVLRECSTGEENDSGAMKLVMDNLMELCKGRTLLLIHHTHKLNPQNGQPNPVNAARGSSYITGKADAIWLLHNNVLAINSRFHLDERRDVSRLSNGLWRVT